MVPAVNVSAHEFYIGLYEVYEVLSHSSWTRIEWVTTILYNHCRFQY